MSLADCGWIERRQNLVVTGATGTGKCWLSSAFGKQACRTGQSVYFSAATNLFEDLAHADSSLLKLRRLLIIDDLGISCIDVRLGLTLLEIIDQQSVQGSLLITSQFPSDRWYNLFDDPTVTDAILDRIVHRAHFLQLKGESMRKLHGKKV